jgi:hypothetical protein
MVSTSSEERSDGTNEFLRKEEKKDGKVSVLRLVESYNR